MFIPAVIKLPSETDKRKNPIIIDLREFGAWVYENSRHDIDISTSDAVRIAYDSTCQPIDGV